MQKKKLYIISSIFLVIILCLISFDFFRFCIKIFPFIFFISPLFYIKKIVDYFKSNKKKKTLHSESIFQKRIKRFKSIKRGYYSLIILGVLYIASLIGPLWMNNKPLIVHFSNNTYDIGEEFNDINNNGKYDYGESFIDETNGKYDIGEEFNDLNNNGKYDEIGESFIDEKKYYFPAVRDFFSFIPGIKEARYGADTFNQKTGSAIADFRLLDQELKNDTTNYIIMPFYKYHPHEDLSDQLDESFTDTNNNGKWDIGESFIDENSNNKYDTYNPPTKPGESLRHIAGTESSGRDVFARLVDGYKISITFAIIVSTLGYIIGIMIGACLGYFGGRLDLFGVRLIEIFSSVPFLFVLMILAGFMKPGIFLLAFLSVILKGWIGITMYIRGEFFREKPKDYVSAAVSMGQSTWKIIIKHILPNALTPIITFAPFAVIGYISSLVALDFLGFGLQPPTPSWGELLVQGKGNLQYWHLIIVPLSAIGITLFLITFIGEAIREAFDPKVFSRLR